MVVHDLRNPTNAIISISENINQEFEEEFSKVTKLRKIFNDQNLDIINEL